MSTRYVWGRYTAQKKQEYRQVYDVTSQTENNAFVNLTKEQDYKFWMGTGCNCYSSSGEMYLTGSIREYQGGSGHTGDTYGSGYILMANNTVLYSSNWKAVDEWMGGSGFGLRGGSRRYSSYLTSKLYTYYVQGSFIDWKTGNSRYSYSDGYSGGDYYTYQGRDNIDPAAVNLPENIRGGSVVNVSVNPSAGQKYEGLISYQYQYRLDGGNWVTIGTSGVSESFTVPNGTQTVQVRVRAQDDLGFVSNDWITSGVVSVVNNSPPSAPGSIDVRNAIAGNYATITITEATDSDGYVTGYIFERSVDGGSWKEVSETSSLAYFERIYEDWATVQYRVCAVDNEDARGPYITSELYTVQVDYVMISGPEADLGSVAGVLSLETIYSTSDDPEAQGIAVKIEMDGALLVDRDVNAGDKIVLNIDTRLQWTGVHHISVTAELEDHMPANQTYTYTIGATPADLISGGESGVLQGPDGKPVLPKTLAQDCYGTDGKDVNTLIAEGLQMTAGGYIGTGTSGEGAPNTLAFGFAPRLLVLYKADDGEAVILGAAAAAGSGTVGGISYTFSTGGASWYASTPATQMNESGQNYGYFAIGNWQKPAET